MINFISVESGYYATEINAMDTKNKEKHMNYLPSLSRYNYI